MILTPEYFAAAPTLTTGVTIVYWGSGLLSKAIEAASTGPSHVQLVEYVDLARGPVVVESTIEGHRNGIQRNPLRSSIQAYPSGSSIAALYLKPEYAARANWSKLTPLVTSQCGKVRYDVLGLLAELLPSALRQSLGREKSKFCSAAWAAWMIACGVLEPVLNPNTVTPEQVIAMSIWDHYTVLAGKPDMKRWNTL